MPVAMGPIELPDGGRLGVSNPHKVFWPQGKLTKGDLLRYYVEASPYILPAVAESPARHEAVSQWRNRYGVLSAT
jgi:DNA primase